MKEREKKKREKKQRLERRRLRNKQRIEKVLAGLGLLEEFQALPGWMRDRVVRMLPAEPAVVIDPAALGRPHMDLLKKDIEQVFDVRGMRADGAAGFRFTEDGTAFRLTDYLSMCWALPTGLVGLPTASLSRRQRRACEEIVDRTYAMGEQWFMRGARDLNGLLQTAMLMDSRIDQGVFGYVAHPEPARPGKPVFRVTLVRAEPRESRVAIDGKVRPVFQCGLPDWAAGIRWMEADGEHFGLDKGSKYPLCIQSHALRKLKERFPAGRAVEVVVRQGLLESLSSPQVAAQQGDAYLIAYHMHGLRLGYLVSRAAQDRIVITTFLFLTMEGTPEYRLLKEKLRLCRRDIEHLNLDRLETFLSPDILRDEGLVAVLTDCGCGSLLELARFGFP
jgi:hypothetical protein